MKTLEERIIKQGKLFLGKKDRGECYITWELRNTDKGPEFSAQAEHWLPSKRDCQQCGQCVEEIAGWFPDNTKAQRILSVWREYHLNGMNAGTPKQTEAIKEFFATVTSYPENDYTHQCAHLESKGLLVDDGYRYGTAWLYRPIPQYVINEILSW